jgi:hypothetical protein
MKMRKLAFRPVTKDAQHESKITIHQVGPWFVIGCHYTPNEGLHK